MPRLFLCLLLAPVVACANSSPKTTSEEGALAEGGNRAQKLTAPEFAQMPDVVARHLASPGGKVVIEKPKSTDTNRATYYSLLRSTNLLTSGADPLWFSQRVGNGCHVFKAVEMYSTVVDVNYATNGSLPGTLYVRGLRMDGVSAGGSQIVPAGSVAFGATRDAAFERRP